MEQGARKRGGEYFLYGALVGLEINFGSEENMKAVFESLLKLKKLRYGLTFHYSALGEHLNITSKFMIDELTKKHSSKEYDVICDHFCEILNSARSHDKEYFSDEIKELIKQISINTSDDRFEYFIQYPRSYFDLNELESLVKLVAFSRFGYDENMTDDELDKFIKNNLYECSYLLHAVKIFADDGSEIAKQWLSKDSVHQKIDSMFKEQDSSAIAALLEGLESDGSLEQILDYIVSKSKESINCKKTTLNSIIDGKAYHGLGLFIIDELIAYEEHKDDTMVKLALEAATKYIDRYTNDELSVQITSEIISIFNKILNSRDNLDVLKFILDTVGSIRYGEPNEKISTYLLSIFQAIPSEIQYNAASCLNRLGKWNEHIENTFLAAIDVYIDEPVYLYGHISQIRKGNNVSDTAMNRVLDLLINHPHPVIKMFAIDCLGWRTYEPSVPHIIEIMRLGPQSKEQMKLEIRDDEGVVNATFWVQPPQLANFATDDVYTTAIHALARLKEYSVEQLLDSLTNDDENISMGAFLVFELHKQRFEDITFTDDQMKLIAELKKQAGI